MKKGWQTVKLGDICELNYGKSLVSSKRVPGSIPVFSSAGITGYNNIALWNGEGIIIGRKGSVGTVFFSPKPFYCIDTAYYIKPSDKYNLKFLYYLLNTLGLEKLNSDSAVPGLNRENAYSQVFSFPPLSEQETIANVLSVFDDKIENNNKLNQNLDWEDYFSICHRISELEEENQNLEAQAQAIFKSWFVDFEPFKDQPFIDSPLGKIPQGWKVCELKTISKVITKGTTPTTMKKQFVESGVNFVKAESILDNHSFDLSRFAYIDEETNKILSRSQLMENDILLTIAGTIGRFAIVNKEILPANTNQAIGIIRIDEEKVNPLYIYNLFLCGLHKEFLTSKVVQAVQANLSLGVIGSLPVIMPSEKNLNNYCEVISPIFDSILDNQKQAQALTQLRDTLLPKLMSGEIDVSEVAV